MAVRDLREVDPPDDHNVYFSVCPLADEAVSRAAGDVAKIRALWCDLDYKTLHTEDNALAVVDALSDVLDSPCAAVVHTGNGVHAYWRVRNSADDSADVTDRNRGWVADLVLRWGGLVQRVADSVEPGARVDNVYDLARIMRLPGSMNVKDPDSPAPVVVDLLDPAARDKRGRAPAIGLSRLGRILREVGAEPISGRRSVLRSVDRAIPESEVVDWVNSVPGADADAHEMSPELRELVDRHRLVDEFCFGADGAASAYEHMTKLVWRAVMMATEGHAGLACALISIQWSYGETMARRGSPDFPEVNGHARDAATAEVEFMRAVRGAVAEGRRRGVVPRGPDGRLIFRTRSEDAS
ncbi:hypothetical protein K3888_15860 [Dietzia aurantiaca]|uniref:hypothetical protein n=1 Tax=Dietzia aurantiaca TaxID=983873 RepID=UPI001E48CE11|nr:hypothetical protein [Dietzia aurantiaca]MCD2264173.1 hypothetical protein [Dietzia aurantiaca]